MSDHLVATGYKDAAAVLAGGALEAHLRQLCKKHRVEVEVDGKAKKAESVNAD